MKLPSNHSSTNSRKPAPSPIFTSGSRKSLKPPTLPIPLSTKSEPVPSTEKRNNLENWFKALLRCREKRKIEMKLSADFCYIVYSLVTFSVGRPGCAADISDGLLLCELLNTVYPGIVNPLAPCKSREDKIRNLAKYCDTCLKIGIKAEELLDIESFLQNKGIPKSLEHFYALYKVITRQFPDYKLPICPFDVIDLIDGEESIKIMTKLLSSIQHSLKIEKPEPVAPIKSEGYMNHLMKMTTECKKVTQQLILMETQANLQKHMISVYQSTLGAFQVDPSTFFVGATSYKIKQRYQLREDDFETLKDGIKKLNALYEKWKKLPNVEGEYGNNEVIILNEDIFDEYSQYYSQYKTQRAGKRQVESEQQDFGTKNIAIQCNTFLENSIHQRVQVTIPSFGSLNFHEDDIPEQEEENIEEPLEMIQGLKEDRNQLLKLLKERRSQLEEANSLLKVKADFEWHSMKLTQRVQELEKELRQVMEENSLCMSKIAENKGEQSKLEKALIWRDEEFKNMQDKEEQYRAQIIELKIQLAKAKEAETEHTNEISRAFEKFQLITMNNQKIDTNSRLLVEQLLESNKKLMDKLKVLEDRKDEQQPIIEEVPEGEEVKEEKGSGNNIMVISSMGEDDKEQNQEKIDEAEYKEDLEEERKE